LEYESENRKEERDNLINSFGNLVHESVPVSKDEKDNIVVREWGNPAESATYHHSEILQKLGMYNTEKGRKITGHRGYYLTGDGVYLNQALIQYGLSFLHQKDYTPLQTPFMMTAKSMRKTAQLSEFNELLYSVEGDSSTKKKYLIATSEQPISCYHEGEWINKKRLPLRYSGYSTCFRKEAGSHGKDLRGLFRVHQFEKVEQFCICAPDKSWEMHEEMLKSSEEFLQALNIPYRVVCIVSGELNNAAAKKYDIEGWFPNTQEYRELVSCSNCTDYQSRKLLVRYGHKEKGKKAEFVHMLNCTLCATERLMCCIAENCQTETGIDIPEVLWKYMPNGKTQIKVS
jgi:seryl-tRNA synthetase